LSPDQRLRIDPHPDSLLGILSRNRSLLMNRWFMIAAAGAVGALARYALQGLLQRGPGFPWGTVGVNVLGCFLAGALWAAFENRVNVSPDVRAMALIGFAGSFTTFSTLILESHHLARGGEIFSAFANVALQLCLGIGALILGVALGRTL
jgi:fluoride exporter